LDHRLHQTPGFDGSLLPHVVNSADAIAANWPSAARSFLRHIAGQAPAGDAASRIACLFSQSMLARIDGDASGGGNLYSDEPTPGAMLAAFQKLVEATPFIRFGYAAANAAILQAVGAQPEICLVDIGIGSGSQWFGFLDQLAAGSARRPSVRMVGVDVPISADESAARLDDVGESLREHAEQRGIAFSFQSKPTAVQDLDFDCLQRRPGEALAVNAVFALHHVPTTDGRSGAEDSRTSVLRRIRKLRPDVLTIVEPDAEHNALPLNLLARESIAHYLTVFDALATLLPGDEPERRTLEQAFFGREIRNIMSTDGLRRVERHERHANWRRRLKRHGFAPLAINREPEQLAEDLSAQRPVSIRPGRDGLLLTWKNRPVVAASAWTPRGVGRAACDWDYSASAPPCAATGVNVRRPRLSYNFI
jgi:hypothetical protein